MDELDVISEFFRTHTYCGAKTKKDGAPCMRRDIFYPNGRCRLHGGLSTGPKTLEGKKRSALNGFKRKNLDENKPKIPTWFNI